MKVTLINNYNFLFGGMSWIHFYFTLSPNSRTISFTPVGQSILGMGLAQKKKKYSKFLQNNVWVSMDPFTKEDKNHWRWMTFLFETLPVSPLTV